MLHTACIVSNMRLEKITSFENSNTRLFITLCTGIIDKNYLLEKVFWRTVVNRIECAKKSRPMFIVERNDDSCCRQVTQVKFVFTTEKKLKVNL